MASDFRDLRIWSLSLELSVRVYQYSINLQKMCHFTLADQIRRSSISVPSNIAEGFGRRSNPEFRHFLKYAAASLNELMTQLILCKRLDLMGSLDYDQLEREIITLSKMIRSFHDSLG
jgi:four helix bundle protein